MTSNTEQPVDEEAEDEDEGINTDELIAAVSASAEQGIALFSQWLGLNLKPKLNVTSKDGPLSQSSRIDATRNVTSRMTRKILGTHNERSEERLKQLLSAQDNIMKESVRIDQPYTSQTTFVYSAPVQQVPQKPKDSGRALENKAPERLTVVLQASQRGGRAYNIHQHVNEV